MGLFVDLYFKVSGLWDTVVDLLPLLGAIGSMLSVAASICLRSSSAKDAHSLVYSLQPTASELASMSLAVGMIRAHFKHVSTENNVLALSAPRPGA